MDDFLQKSKKVVRIVLYGPAISQSDCKKASLYQLPFNLNVIITTSIWIACADNILTESLIGTARKNLENNSVSWNKYFWYSFNSLV